MTSNEKRVTNSEQGDVERIMTFLFIHQEHKVTQKLFFVNLRDLRGEKEKSLDNACGTQGTSARRFLARQERSLGMTVTVTRNAKHLTGNHSNSMLDWNMKQTQSPAYT